MRSRISPHSTRLCVVWCLTRGTCRVSLLLHWKWRQLIPLKRFLCLPDYTAVHPEKENSLNLLLFRQLLTALKLQTKCLKVDTISVKDLEPYLIQQPNEALLGDFVQSRGFPFSGEWRRATGWAVIQWRGVVSEKSGVLSYTYIAAKTTKLA